MILRPANLFQVLVSLLLSGCFVSDVPAIISQSAEDLGPELTYTMFEEADALNPGEISETDLLRLVRGVAKSYQMQMLNSGTPDEVLVVAEGVYVRRLGWQDSNVVHVVQLDLDEMELSVDFNSDEMGFKYLFYPVAISESGDGVVAFMSCPLRDGGALAKQYGLELVCAGGIAKNTPRISNRPESEDIWRFLQATLAADLFDWEDMANDSVMSWIQ